MRALRSARLPRGIRSSITCSGMAATAPRRSPAPPAPPPPPQRPERRGAAEPLLERAVDRHVQVARDVAAHRQVRLGPGGVEGDEEPRGAPDCVWDATRLTRR